MTDDFDPRLEQLAEAVVFAHESGQPGGGGPAAADAAALERTAALATAALAAAPRAAVPPALQARLAAAALGFCAERQAVRRATDVPPPAARGPRGPGRGWLLGFVAGAAAGVALWLLAGGTPQLPPAERRQALLASTPQPQLTRWDWKGGPSPLRGSVQGEVVWRTDRQEGYLTFRGLPPLDPEHRFQLWIVDGSREGAPVDGGLFAIANGDVETVVPIDPKLPIRDVKGFVVTVEDKDGAVVSKQAHVVAIAGL